MSSKVLWGFIKFLIKLGKVVKRDDDRLFWVWFNGS